MTELDNYLPIVCSPNPLRCERCEKGLKDICGYYQEMQRDLERQREQARDIKKYYEGIRK